MLIVIEMFLSGWEMFSKFCIEHIALDIIVRTRLISDELQCKRNADVLKKTVVGGYPWLNPLNEQARVVF